MHACMDNELGQGGGTRRRVPEKSRRNNSDNNDNNGAGPTIAPCGACKFLRRKCLSGCIFAPHFGSDQGSARFAAVHKVFGASNVSKLLMCIPADKRHDAAVTVSYEAQARLSDPVYGCVSTIIALQQQVASLQAELSMVQTHLVNSRFVTANALNNQNSIVDHQQQEQALQQIALLQPAYSNATCLDLNAISNNYHQDSNFGTNFVETALQTSNNSFEKCNYLHPLRSLPLENGDGYEDEAEVIYASNH